LWLRRLETNGKISEIVDDSTVAESDAILVNAVYFKVCGHMIGKPDGKSNVLKLQELSPFATEPAIPLQHVRHV
jgi:hypothetical protein